MTYARDELDYTDREIVMESGLDVDEIPAHTLKAIITAMKKGQKITAIKHYREVTGASLVDAKRIIETIRIEPAGTDKAGVNEPVTVNMGRSNSLLFFVVVTAVILLAWQFLS